MRIRLIALGLAFLGVAFYLNPALAQTAVEAAGEVSVRPLLDELAPLIVSLASAGLFGIALWLAGILKKKFGVDIEKAIKDIEARHREALHSAVYTAVAAARAKSGVDNLKISVGSEELAKIIRAVRDSVPDAIAYLTPSDAVIARLAEAKAVEVAAKAASVPPAR
jgi:hypothetical protein